MNLTNMTKTINGIEYTYNNHGSYIELIDAKIPDGVTHLEISDIDGVPVTSIGDYFMCYNKTLTSVSLPKATTIGNNFLCYNKTLTSISLPKVTTIGDYFMCYNKTLTSISLPKVTTIGDYFLGYNETLTSISLPKATTIGNNFLCYNETLTSISLPKATNIGNNFLYYNKTLTSVSLPKVTTIGYNFLGYNETLTSISLPKVTTIGYNFLYYNKTLTSVSLPKVTTIGDYFMCCNEPILINNGEIINADGIPVFVSKKKKLGELTVHYGAMNSRDGKETYVVSFGELHSHGTTIAEAKEDLLFKIAQKDFNPEKVVAEIKKTGMVTLTQYRLITGACRQGCANFLEQNNLAGTTQLPLEQALKLTGNAWGGEKLKSLLN